MHMPGRGGGVVIVRGSEDLLWKGVKLRDRRRFHLRTNQVQFLSDLLVV